MISDILSGSILSIRNYQNTMPESYRDLANELDAVTTVMTAMRVYLDSWPGSEHQLPLRKALSRLDVSELRSVIDGSATND